jgi:hypothetical protein
VFGVSSEAQNQDLPFFPCQEMHEIQDLVTLDNVTIEVGFLSTCLVVGVSWNGGSEAAEQQYLHPQVMLALSMNNISWRRMESHTHSFESYENASRYFRVDNSLFHPFPFDVEPNETLYVCILYGTDQEGLGLPVSGVDRLNRQTPSVGIVVTSGISRQWYFTIDWRIPAMFCFVLSWVGAVFLMSRTSKDTKSEN